MGVPRIQYTHIVSAGRTFPCVGGNGRKAGMALAAVAAALSACGAPASPTPDFVVRDTPVVIQSRAPFTQRVDFPARVESTLGAALRYWGGDWSALRGVTITFQDEQYVACGPHAGSLGCFDGEIRLTTRDPGFTFYCVEETVLVHEVGHAVIGDPDHADPRWMDFASVVPELEGRTGYAAEGEVPCQIFPSVWRHLPRR